MATLMNTTAATKNTETTTHKPSQRDTVQMRYDAQDADADAELLFGRFIGPKTTANMEYRMTKRVMINN